MRLIGLELPGNVAEILHLPRLHPPLLQQALDALGNAAVVLHNEYFEHLAPPRYAVNLSSQYRTFRLKNPPEDV